MKLRFTYIYCNFMHIGIIVLQHCKLVPGTGSLKQHHSVIALPSPTLFSQVLISIHTVLQLELLLF